MVRSDFTSFTRQLLSHHLSLWTHCSCRMNKSLTWVNFGVWWQACVLIKMGSVAVNTHFCPCTCHTIVTLRQTVMYCHEVQGLAARVWFLHLTLVLILFKKATSVMGEDEIRVSSGHFNDDDMCEEAASHHSFTACCSFFRWSFYSSAKSLKWWLCFMFLCSL